MSNIRGTQQRRQAILDSIKAIDETNADDLMTLLGINPAGRARVMKDLLVLEENGYIQANKPKGHMNRRWMVTDKGRLTVTVPMGLNSTYEVPEEYPGETKMEKIIRLATKIQVLENELEKLRTELKEIV